MLGIRSRSRPLISLSNSWCKVHAIGRRGYRDRWLYRRSFSPGNVGERPRTLMTGATHGLRYDTENEGRTMKVTWADGGTAAFHAVWLRHNCQCPNCVTSSNQKAVDPSILDPRTTVTPNSLSGPYNCVKLTCVCISHIESWLTGGVLRLSWSCGHTGYIDTEWLKSNQHSNPETVDTSGDLSRPSLAVSARIFCLKSDFDCWSFQTKLPVVSVTTLSDEEGLWM